MKLFAVWLITLALLGGCSPGHEATRQPLTETQRDSVLSRSSLPGATVVGRAMRVQDVSAHRAASLDTLSR